MSRGFGVPLRLLEEWARHRGEKADVLSSKLFADADAGMQAMLNHGAWQGALSEPYAQSLRDYRKSNRPANDPLEFEPWAQAALVLEAAHKDIPPDQSFPKQADLKLFLETAAASEGFVRKTQRASGLNQIIARRISGDLWLWFQLRQRFWVPGAGGTINTACGLFWPNSYLEINADVIVPGLSYYRIYDTERAAALGCLALVATLDELAAILVPVNMDETGRTERGLRRP